MLYSVVQHALAQNPQDRPVNIDLLYCCTSKSHFRGAPPLFFQNRHPPRARPRLCGKERSCRAIVAMKAGFSVPNQSPRDIRGLRRVPAALRTWRSHKAQKFGDKARVPARTRG
jgi:hypothetical protein